MPDCVNCRTTRSAPCLVRVSEAHVTWSFRSMLVSSCGLSRCGTKHTDCSISSVVAFCGNDSRHAPGSRRSHWPAAQSGPASWPRKIPFGVSRQIGNHATQVGQEAHVEHTVGFVENESTPPDRQAPDSSGPAVGRASRQRRRRRRKACTWGSADTAQDNRVPKRRMVTVGQEAFADLHASYASGTVPAHECGDHSRVGLPACVSRCNIGNAKAAVLPVPVSHSPIRRDRRAHAESPALDRRGRLYPAAVSASRAAQPKLVERTFVVLREYPRTE